MHWGVGWHGQRVGQGVVPCFSWVLLVGVSWLFLVVVCSWFVCGLVVVIVLCGGGLTGCCPLFFFGLVGVGVSWLSLVVCVYGFVYGLVVVILYKGGRTP